MRVPSGSRKDVAGPGVYVRRERKDGDGGPLRATDGIPAVDGRSGRPLVGCGIHLWYGENGDATGMDDPGAESGWRRWILCMV